MTLLEKNANQIFNIIESSESGISRGELAKKIGRKQRLLPTDKLVIDYLLVSQRISQQQIKSEHGVKYTFAYFAK
jgi:hypothetical protein